MSAHLLQTALNADDTRQALAAARALRGIEGEQRAALLTTLAAELTNAGRQRRAAMICGEIGALSLTPQLRDLLGWPRWPVREAALHALTRIDASEEASRSVAAACALHDRSAPVRLAALELLAQRSLPVPTVIVAALSHRHPRVRCRALRAVARLAPQDHLEALSNAFQHSHRRVRRTAALLLGGLGEGALPALGNLARCRCDGDAAVARAARDSFVALRTHLPAALEPLCGAHNDPVALLAEFPAELRSQVEIARQRRRDALARRGASLDPRAEARWMIGRLVEQIVLAHQGTAR